MKKWTKWKKGIAGILAGAVFLGSMPASAQDLLTDGRTEPVAESLQEANASDLDVQQNGTAFTEELTGEAEILTDAVSEGDSSVPEEGEVLASEEGNTNPSEELQLPEEEGNNASPEAPQLSEEETFAPQEEIEEPPVLEAEPEGEEPLFEEEPEEDVTDSEALPESEEEKTENTGDIFSDGVGDTTGTEAAPEQITEYPTYDSMTIAELLDLDENTVGAATETPGDMAVSMFALTPEEAPTWSFDTYYVGQTDSHYVYKTYDFSLKYQMEFHTDYDLTEPGDVVIKIPRILLKERDADGGKEIVPGDIAVPQGGKNSDGTYVAVESRVTPFNYYIDGEYLVFYNYKTIQAGTNAAWQVLYKNLDVSKIVDKTQWKLNPIITVENTDGMKEEKETIPLTGKVHTTSVIREVTKDVLNISGKNYGPGLYTKNQVKSVLGVETLPTEFEENFEKYVYVGWNVLVDVDVVQPVSLDFQDISEYTTEKGYIRNAKTVGMSVEMKLPYYTDEDAEYDKRYKKGIRNIHVVSAYPRAEVKEGTKVQNEFKVTMTLYDTKEKKSDTDSAYWLYKDYNFTWSGNIYQAWKYDRTSYAGWLNVFDSLQGHTEKEAESYLDAFPFTTRTYVNGYGITHHVNKENLGERIPGSYYEVETKDGFFSYDGNPIEGSSDYADRTVSDGYSLHAYSNTDGQSGEDVVLTEKDFYIKNLSVCRRDRDYDVWEDRYIEAPEFDVAVDQTIKVYASYGAPIENKEPDWQWVCDIPWKEGNHSNGEYYRVSNEDLKNDSGQYPVAIKTYYKGISYKSDCYLDFDVQLRHTSPTIKSLLEGDDNKERSITVWNTARNDFSYNPGEGSVETDSWPSLYRSEQANVSYIGKVASSTKTARVSSDAVNGRTMVDYNLTAWSGYSIYSRETLNYLQKKIGTELLFPDLQEGKKQWIFYDLLPYGMTLDFTKPIVAGRINQVDGNYQDYPQSWDETDVSVSVNPQNDIIDNWKNTGRTMIKFHLSYTGEDPTSYITVENEEEYDYNKGFWMEGWGVSFRARYDWEDSNLLEKDANICAFTPKDPSVFLVGAEYENGMIPEDSYGSDYRPFGAETGGIREEGTAVPGIKNILYSKTRAVDDVAVASTSTIKKKVRADKDNLNDYGATAIVETGKNYTYDITVTSGGTPTKDIVIYDRLEYAVKDRTDKDTMDFGGRTELNQIWFGKFAGLDTSELEAAGIDVKIYYSDKRDAARPAGINGESLEYKTPDDVLEKSTDWLPENEWIQQGKKLSDVKAVTVDIRQKKGNKEEYVLPAMESIGFKIKMKAPEILEEKNIYTYNNPAYYSCPDNSKAPEMVAGNSVRVELVSKVKNLEVTKEFENLDEVPAIMRKQDFVFTITYPEVKEGDKTVYPPFAYQVYTLYRKNESGIWQEEADGQVHTTDKEGKITLYAGEKAVFKDVPGADSLIVTEEESPFWKVKMEENKDSQENTRVVKFENTYQPVVYIQKKIQGVPEEKKEKVKEHSFVFQIEASHMNGETEIRQEFKKGTEFWLVDIARTDGGIPNKTGVRYFEEDGLIRLKPGETAAVFLDSIDSTYTVRELLEKSSNPEEWLCKEPQKTGNASVYGSKVEITNAYRFKDLILEKEILHQDKADVDKLRKNLPFTFEIKEVVKEDGIETEKVVTGKQWILLNSDGTEPEKGVLPDKTEEGEVIAGELNDQGRFTCAMANRKVKIKGLEAGKTYVICEIDYTAEGEDYPEGITEEQKKLLEIYKPVNGGVVEVNMPAFSTGKEVVISNDYQKRSLTVSKQILLSEKPTPEEVKEAEHRSFVMTVYINNQLLAGASYELLENGKKPVVSQTDENGQLSLKDGQSAYFKDVGLLGDTFKVEETPDTESNGILFSQIYPPKNAAFEGSFGGNNAEANFINGKKERLTVIKEYVGGDEIGSEIAESIPVNPERQEEFAVEAEFVFYDRRGEIIKTGSGIGNTNDITVIDLTTGESSIHKWNIWERTLTLEPGKMYIFPEKIYYGTGRYQRSTIDSYEITEAKTDYGYLYQLENAETGKKEDIWLHIQQKPLAAVSGTVAKKPLAKLVNEITVPGWESGTLIEKRMALDSKTHMPQKVKEGAILTLRLERYQEKSKTWIPAADVPYLQSDRKIFDEYGFDISADYKVTEGNYGVSGADGTIICMKSRSKYDYPVLYFLNNTVYLNFYKDTMPDGSDIKDGTLRLVEIPEMSDSDWGALIGYGTAGNLSYSMKEREGTILYNRTGNFPVDIEKVMETDNDETFIMLLKQVLSHSTEPIKKPEHILKSQVVPGIPYIVYDRETGEEISQNQTGRNGEIFLKAGQYARLELPEDTKWTVEEQQSMTTELKDLTGTPLEKMTVLSDNLILINQPSEEIQVGTITYDPNGGSFGYKWGSDNKKIPILVQRISYYMDGEVPKKIGQYSPLEPKKEGEVLDGWYKDKECKEPFILEEYNCQEDLTVYAKWKPRVDVKYAVTLYGIQKDTWKDESATGLAGLTFGPATGESYIEGYKAHQDENSSGHCIHWDSWEEIVKQSKENPEVYRQCLEFGCTKAVELTLNKKLKSDSYDFSNIAGDGASVLNLSIIGSYQNWNAKQDTTGGWPASRIRATLNGADKQTNLDVAGTNVLSVEESLMSCFPKELQSGIVPKEVKTNTNSSFDGLETTYDRLWLFSVKELFNEKVASTTHKDEGVSYKNWADGAQGVIGYNEKATPINYLLRCRGSEKYQIYEVGKDGNVTIYQYFNAGFAPGFCIR